MIEYDQFDGNAVMKKSLLIGLGLLIGVGGGLAITRFGLTSITSKKVQPSPSPVNKLPDFHHHVDLRIMIDGKQLDLSKEEYQSSTYVYKDEHVHLHDKNGSVVHLHQPGVTVGDFLETLNMELSDECFTLYVDEDGLEAKSVTTTELDKQPERVVVENHCKQSNDGKTLVVMVNGMQQLEADKYLFEDLDKVLIYFGEADQTLIQEQMALVSDDACLYSETCPERGKPPIENCVASADTPCVVVE